MCFRFSIIVLITFYLVATVVESNDIVVGYATPYSRKIYSAIKYENPALWIRTDDLMVSAPNHDIISAVYVTDLRPDKEGIAYIEAGGVGQKTVTIALRSPSILREYKFAVEVYAQNVHSTLGGAGLGYSAQLSGYPQSSYGSYPHTQLSGYGSQYSGAYNVPSAVGYPSTNPYALGKKK